ncbi:MAG: shikimate kinase [Planctomycetes bacterium GWF2_41_51]|nr:MAG: shikimate kinase [Planctomycetes bacterium GWF2_41_51]HBG25920.1 shikimate kinase [Phycisphaerales bacterium]
MDTKKNIVLIGMPAVGKSTIGVLLAKRLGRYFLDTDVYIQAVVGRTLQNIIDSDGLEEFCKIESEHICCIDKTDCVIATGGSAVYSNEAMNHLKSNGIIVYLDLPLEMIKKRLTDLNIRGVVMSKGQTLDDLYKKRTPLYEKWAEVTIDCLNLSHEQTVDKIIEQINL